jgi:hypothetical protein
MRTDHEIKGGFMTTHNVSGSEPRESKTEQVLSPAAARKAVDEDEARKGIVKSTEHVQERGILIEQAALADKREREKARDEKK